MCLHTHTTHNVIRGVLEAFLPLQNCGVQAPRSHWHSAEQHISNPHVRAHQALLQQCALFRVCVIQFLQPSFQWAMTRVTLMSSFCSETLQHLCSSRAIAACCLLPLRLAMVSLTLLSVGTRYKIHGKVRPQNAAWLPKWRRCSPSLST